MRDRCPCGITSRNASLPSSYFSVTFWMTALLTKPSLDISSFVTSSVASTTCHCLASCQIDQPHLSLQASFSCVEAAHPSGSKPTSSSPRCRIPTRSCSNPLPRGERLACSRPAPAGRAGDPVSGIPLDLDVISSVNTTDAVEHAVTPVYSFRPSSVKSLHRRSTNAGGSRAGFPLSRLSFARFSTSSIIFF